MNRICITLIGALASATSLFAQAGSDDLDPSASRELIRQWVQTERLISEEKNDWKVEKQRMQDLLDLYQKELKLLNEEIEKAGASAELADDRKVKLGSELKEYRDAQRLLADSLVRLLPRARLLVKRLPEPLQNELATDISVLTSAEAMQKPRNVLKSMLNVLTSAGQFNRSITVAEETRDLDGGEKMTVSVIYLGLARAYFAASAGDSSGVGTPAKDGWQWQDRPELADDIRRAMAVYKKDQQPQLIQLPVELKKSNQATDQ